MIIEVFDQFFKSLAISNVLPMFSGICSFVGVLFLISIFSLFSKNIGLMDEPDHRKLHVGSVPLVGGLAIYLVILATLLVLELPDKVIWLICTSSLLVLVGSIDDAIGLSIKLRLAAQFLTVSLMIVGSEISLLDIGIARLDSSPLTRGAAFILTVIAVVGLTNAFNMVDGIDGLASGQMIVSLVSVTLTLQFLYGEIYQESWIITMMGAVLGFFVCNLSLAPVKRVFLGDAGSMLLGYLMAWTLIYYSQQPISLLAPIAALWIVSFPTFDTLAVMGRRLKYRSSPFLSDRLHLHHIMLDLGLSSRKVLVIITLCSFGISLFGIWLTHATTPEISIFFYGFCFIIYFKTKDYLSSKISNV